MYNNLYELSYPELKKMALDMELKPRRSKNDLVKSIAAAFSEYEEYKKVKIDRYKKIRQLGENGKEGTTYLVVTPEGVEYAMKTFRKQKSSSKLRKEAELQKIASSTGASPAVIDIDTVSKYIVMEKLDKHLWDLIVKNEGVLSTYYQKQIITIFKKLDNCGVFHGDANIMNYMIKKKRLFIIDFGMAKEITNELQRKLGTSTPNIKIMTLGLVLKLKELNCNPKSYSHLAKYLSEEEKFRFKINCSL